ncbi:acyltransferase [Apibacter muscae]|uniref:Acyltransferase n=1 Tax=Apibacter muscae TaxID=2509004 RepID=A0A563DBI1_9FLAO|nr:acyltransferase [Apibacter muscae]TWP27293.1 acyltransferase [Apibacter muscae]
MKNQREMGIDNLRFAMVVLVIALHAAMTFMDYVPEWWYVINPKRSLGFTYLVVILDTFPMTVLFFLSGYFAPNSLKKRGTLSFIRNKTIHIAIPWMLGVLFVAPFFSRLTMSAYGYPSIPFISFYLNDFLGVFYQQAHYWFLGVLFLFFIIYAWASPKKIKLLNIASSWMIFFTIFLTAVAYFLSTRYYKPANGWTNVGYLLYFQPARFMGYFLMFFLGIYAQNKHWFKVNGWKPSLKIFLSISFISMVGVIIIQMNLLNNITDVQKQIAEAIFYSLASVSLTILLITLCMRVHGSVQKIIHFFSPYSYGIYWLHQIILMLILQFLLNINIPIFIKWFLSIVITIFISTILTKYVLKKLLIFKKMF